MTKSHTYEVQVTWTGNTGSGTSGYRDYGRDHDISGVGIPGKPMISGTADPSFRGSAQAWNPEELLVASLSQCHLLWYLALCARDGIIVTDYTDKPVGTMTEDSIGAGRFVEVRLRPEATITNSDRLDDAMALHEEAHRMCFIANSVNFPVHADPSTKVGGA